MMSFAVCEITSRLQCEAVEHDHGTLIIGVGLPDSANKTVYGRQPVDTIIDQALFARTGNRPIAVSDITQE